VTRGWLSRVASAGYSDGMACYCKDRETNPALAETMKELPAGFCGVCQVCGKPGHTRGHPSLPTTGAWCDEHWQALLEKPGVTPDLILRILVLALALGAIATTTWRLVF
jgi:hypothetical protein